MTDPGDSHAPSDDMPPATRLLWRRDPLPISSKASQSQVSLWRALADVPPRHTCSVMLHITTLEIWKDSLASGFLVDSSLDSEGFIHCSYPDQVLIPANERFADRDDLYLLVIDPSAVAPEVVVEDSYGGGVEFPHVYGPLNCDAVTNVVRFPRSPQGKFTTVPRLDG